MSGNSFAKIRDTSMCRWCAAASRRSVLGMAVAAAGIVGTLGRPVLAAGDEPAPNAISPDDALQRLMDGNARYAANAPLPKDYAAGRAARALSQHPIAGILACADSRVPPEIAFDQGPGELFVVRVAGNFVNDDLLASLEYGTAVLGVPLLMVLGHSGCGAIDATIKVIQQGAELPGHLPGLAKALEPAVQKAIDAKPVNLLDAATVENVRGNVERLRAATPVVAELVTSGKVKVVGAVYDIATGKVSMV
jgi:carbonic anhydrase